MIERWEGRLRRGQGQDSIADSCEAPAATLLACDAKDALIVQTRLTAAQRPHYVRAFHKPFARASRHALHRVWCLAQMRGPSRRECNRLPVLPAPPTSGSEAVRHVAGERRQIATTSAIEDRENGS